MFKCEIFIEYPGKCYSDIADGWVPPGEHTPIGLCMRLFCSQELDLQEETCGGSQARVDDEFAFDLKEPYPKCCTRHNGFFWKIKTKLIFNAKY